MAKPSIRLVKCVGLTAESSDAGFQLDGLYQVVKGSFGLAVLGPKGSIELFDEYGEPTHHADDFKTHACPVVLPKGLKHG